MFVGKRSLLVLLAVVAYLSLNVFAFEATSVSATTTKAKRGKGMMRAAPAKPAAVVARKRAPDAAAQQQAKAAKRNLQPVKRAEPSSRYGLKKRAKVEKKQEKKDYSSFLCPGGSVACPATVTVKSGSAKGVVERVLSPDELSRQLNSLADWFKVGFECIEFENELNSCGGCVTLGSGQVFRAPFSGHRNLMLHPALQARLYNDTLGAKDRMRGRRLPSLPMPRRLRGVARPDVMCATRQLWLCSHRR